MTEPEFLYRIEEPISVSVSAGEFQVLEVATKTLRSEVNEELLKAYEGTESLPFEIKDSDKIAVKIIDDRGVESLKMINIEE